jgi:hypothetical protein
VPRDRAVGPEAGSPGGQEPDRGSSCRYPMCREVATPGTNFERSQPIAMRCACSPSPSFSRAVALAGSTRSATSSVT